MPATTPLQQWALPRLQPLLPLPEEDLLQAISYAASLSSAEAVSQHFKDFLGESHDSLQFISDFNRHAFPRTTANTSSASSPAASAPSSRSGTPSGSRSKKSKKTPINRYPNAPRQANEGLSAAPVGGYIKRDIEDEYYTGRQKSPAPTSSATPPPSKTATPPPQGAVSSTKATGTLTSDLVNVKTKTAKHAPAAKVHITGGTSMRHGANSELSEVESALRALELTTNPTLQKGKERKCNCQGLKHELLAAAPNCLNCGKIICIYEGLQPCSFCHHPLLSGADVHAMIATLRQERGSEKMALDATHNRKADVAVTPRAFQPARDNDSAEAEALRKAQEHRDRLLNFQANNAQRTKIIDQAADFDTGTTGTSIWATPEERAMQLKRQQKAMERVGWANKQDYEKRRVVVAIDLKGRKVVKQMAAIPAPGEESSEEEEVVEKVEDTLSRGGQGMREDKGRGEGRYAKNPLLGGLVRPVFVPEAEGKGKGKGGEMARDEGREERGGWRRVQDDLEDNERVILDGGVGGAMGAGRDTGM